MRCIGISGTPGTGKSTVAKELSLILSIPVLELSDYVIENRLYSYFDKVRNTYVIDEDKVRKNIVELYKNLGGLIIVSHYVEVLPRDIFELVIVLRRNPRKLIDILKMRGWPEYKIAENVEAELLSICTLNAVEELGEEIVVEVDATDKNPSTVVNEIINILFGDTPVYLGHRIDWISLMTEKELDEVFKYIEKHRVW